MWKKRNKNKKTAEESKHWSIYGKPKKKGKHEIVFDEGSRNDYLNGFHNRKVERRKKANEEKKIKDKEARTLEKLQRRNHMAKAIQEMTGQGELEDALKEMLPADEVDDASDNEVDEVFQSTEDNNTNEIVVKYNAPGVVITAITSAVVNEDGEENDGKPGVSAPITAKSSVKHKPSTASGDESKKSKSEIKKINTNKKRKHPSGGHKNKKFPNKKFKKN
jgi:ribosomal RNA-processing protein 17